MELAFQYLVQKDEILENLFNKYGMPYIPSRPQGFETLCKLIIEQQVSLASAKACFLKLKQNINEVTPNTLLAVSEEDLRSYAVSKQKAKYLKALASAVHLKQIDLESLADKDENQVRTKLIQIKGIGNWTIDIYLMFALKSPDLIPLGDIAVVNTIKELYNVTTKDEMVVLSNNWKPFRSYATYLLWHHYLEKRGRKPLIY